MNLNSDQVRAVKYLKDWWKCNNMYVVIDSRAGCGKTFLVNYILKELNECIPLLLTPTQESLNQLRDKTEGDYTFKTIHSALGITPTTSKSELEFEHRTIPSLWSDFNLAVVDEASMVDTTLLNLLISTGVKIIWVGHGSQLPPIDTRRGRNDLCVSPVFDQGWETITLNIPQRNTGALWDFSNRVEEAIYDSSIVLPRDYNISSKKLREILGSKATQESLLAGDTKLALWRNREIDIYNARIRRLLFGEASLKYKYLPLDKIILTNPLTIIEGLEGCTDYHLKGQMRVKNNLTFLYSNTKAEVVASSMVTITLNKELAFPCYKLEVEVDGEHLTIFDFVLEEDRQKVASYYEHVAWGLKDPKAVAKAYRQRHFIMSCFAEIKHYYSASVHRLQGSSISNVIAIKSNIFKNPCRVERDKCFYVAVSRCMDSLAIYNGS